jgi:hypothetical protein
MNLSSNFVSYVNNNFKLLNEIYSNCNPIGGNEEIIVAGCVLNDGKGDWFAMKNMYKKLQKDFPEKTIRLIATSAEKHRDKLDCSGLKNVHLYFGDEVERLPSD